MTRKTDKKDRKTERIKEREKKRDGERMSVPSTGSRSLIFNTQSTISVIPRNSSNHKSRSFNLTVPDILQPFGEFLESMM